ncbi:MAG: hypothetical protein QG666_793 [Euryarchaeota archaeon]|nr:hypothetical protein [Euryarchaeota archaeon]
MGNSDNTSDRLYRGHICDFDKFYWAWFFLIFPMISIFLVVCYLLEGTQITPFLALHIGVTAPLTISALAGITPAPYEE